MKRKYLIPLVAVALISMASCKSGSKSDSEQLSTDLIENKATPDGINADELPAIQFAEESHNFETIFEGEVVEHSFKFTNTGKAPLVISNASASCGCTVPEWPKKAIAPGEEGVIVVKFDTKGKQGVQNKTITVLANTNPNTKILKITGFVVNNDKK